jgi:succinate dehydrogenase / fumarate reductase membrane anchor subunit
VKSLISIGRSGLSNWLLQRVSALIMSAYLIFMLAYFFVNPSPSYTQWSGLHSSLAMRIFSLVY